MSIATVAMREGGTRGGESWLDTWLESSLERGERRRGCSLVVAMG